MNSIKLIEPIFAKKTWGNNQAINKFLDRKLSTKDTLGEIFLVSGLPDILGRSTKIENITLRKHFADNKKREQWFGKVFENTDEFPFLLKFLAVKVPLSLQVHPGDELLGNRRISGKTEGWYALSDAKVLCGFKRGFTQKDFEKLIKDKFFEKKHSIKDLENFLNLIKLKKGEAIYVESGTIHTILEGNLLEPQQPCNTTYRIYDWGRNIKDRPLYLKKALSVLNYNSRPKKISGEGVFLDKPNFKIEHLKIKGKLTKKLEKERFHLILPVGQSIIIDKTTIPPGQCTLIIANTAEIDIHTKKETDIFIALAKN